jgi:C1A family cysteine protease
MAKKKSTMLPTIAPPIEPPIPFPVPETDPEMAVSDAEEEIPSVAPSSEEIVPTPVTRQDLLFGIGKFTKGYKEDPADPRDLVADSLFGAAVRLPAEYSLAQYIGKIRNQESTSSCVGHGLWASVQIREKILGMNSGESSPLGFYALARTLGKATKEEKLRDDGSYPRLAMKAIRDWGIPLESKWPFDPSKVNEELPWDVLQQASGTKVSAWYRIDGIGQGRVLSLMQAISKGYPVVFGTEVDGVYEDWNGQGVIGPRVGRSLGGHCTCIVGYRTERDGTVSFQFQNSWGKGWGQSGLGWLCEQRITMLESRDFYVMVLGG